MGSLVLLVSYITGYRLWTSPQVLCRRTTGVLHSASLRTWPVLWKAGHSFGVVPTLSQFCGQILHMEAQNKKEIELTLSPKERDTKESAATFDLLDRVA